MNKEKWLAWAKGFTAKAATKTTNKSFEFRNQAEVTLPLEIMIFGDIGCGWYDDGSVSAVDFASQLSAIPMDREIRVRINSNGGSVFEGWAIYNLLAERRSNVVCIVDGIAASIASVIAIAGRELQMSEASILMIHNASGMCVGESDDMQEMAAVLDKLSNVIAGIYSRKTGKTVEEVKTAMDSETWLTGPEAKAYGLCDTVQGEDIKPPSAKLSGAKSASAQTTKPNPAGVKAGGAIRNAMNRTQVIALLNKLGVKFEDSATDESLAALLENYTPTAPVAKTDAVPDITAEVRRISNMTAAVNKCATELRIPGASVESFTARCLKDESFLAELQALPPRQVGAEPVTGSVPDAKAKSIKLEAFNKLSPSEKKQFCLEKGKITE